jgi:hypothetical protein
MHPDVIAHMDATNAGNRRNSSEVKVDIISTQQKDSVIWGGLM